MYAFTPTVYMYLLYTCIYMYLLYVYITRAEPYQPVYHAEWRSTGLGSEDEGRYNHEAWYEGWYGLPVWFSVYYRAEQLSTHQDNWNSPGAWVSPY